MTEFKVSKNVTFTMTNIGIIGRYMEEEGIKNFSQAVNSIIQLWVRKEKLVATLEGLAQERAARIEDMERKQKLQEKFNNE